MAHLEFIETAYSMGSPAEAGYFLCVEEQGGNNLEIISAVELSKSVYRDRHYYVIGAADDRAAAFELVRRLIADFIGDGREIDGLRDYIRDMTEGGGGY